MLVFRDEAVCQRATAWHDHGHENNPAVPRWEDTRASSGFNYRMTELQGAVGLAQLKKLPRVVAAQRTNRDQLWGAIAGLPDVEPRTVPEAAYETADALVFLVSDRQMAMNCRKELLTVGLATKILPEAFTWHFAGTWNHMPELVAAHCGNLQAAFPQSHAILSRAVSLPVGVNMGEDVPQRARQAIERAMRS